MVFLIKYAVIIFTSAMIGSVLPFVKNWRTDLLHPFIASGAGVFPGAVFFHLLPDVRATKDAFVFVLVGFLSVFLFEQFTAKRHDHDCGMRKIILSLFSSAGSGDLPVCCDDGSVAGSISYSIQARHRNTFHALLTVHDACDNFVRCINSAVSHGVLSSTKLKKE